MNKCLSQNNIYLYINLKKIIIAVVKLHYLTSLLNPLTMPMPLAWCQCQRLRSSQETEWHALDNFLQKISTVLVHIMASTEQLFLKPSCFSALPLVSGDCVHGEHCLDTTDIRDVLDQPISCSQECSVEWEAEVGIYGESWNFSHRASQNHNLTAYLSYMDYFLQFYFNAIHSSMKKKKKTLQKLSVSPKLWLCITLLGP